MTIQLCSKLYEGTKTLWGATWFLAPILLTHNDTQGGMIHKAVYEPPRRPLSGSLVNRGSGAAPTG